MAWIEDVNSDAGYDTILDAFSAEVPTSYPSDPVTSDNPCVLSIPHGGRYDIFWYRSNRDWKLSVGGADLVTETDQSDVNYKPPPPSTPIIYGNCAYYCVIDSSGVQKIKKADLITGAVTTVTSSTALSSYRVRCNDVDISGSAAVFFSAGFDNYMVNFDCEQSSSNLEGGAAFRGEGPFMEGGGGSRRLTGLTVTVPDESQRAYEKSSSKFRASSYYLTDYFFYHEDEVDNGEPNPMGASDSDYIVWSGWKKDRKTHEWVYLYLENNFGGTDEIRGISSSTSWSFFKWKVTGQIGSSGIRPRIRWNDDPDEDVGGWLDDLCLTVEGHEDVSYVLTKVDLTDDSVTTVKDEDITKTEFNLGQISCGINGSDVYYEFSAKDGDTNYTPSAYKIGLDGTGQASQVWDGHYGYNGMILDGKTLTLADQSKTWTLSYEPRELLVSYDTVYPYYVIGFGVNTVWVDKLASDGSVTKIKEPSLANYSYVGARPYKVRQGTTPLKRNFRAEAYLGGGYEIHTPFMDVL